MNSVEGRMQNTHKIQGHIRSTPKIQGNIRFGNVFPELEDLEITPTEQEQHFKSTKYGYDEVKVKAIEAEEKTVALDFSKSDVSEVTNTSGKYMKKVTINKDEDLIASNIKQGANIYGVEGSVIGLVGQAKQASPAIVAQTIVPDEGYNGLTSVEIAEVTSEIDSNIRSENIKDGISILGVEGDLKVIDTRDATATPGDILAGRTAYVNEKKIAGTIEIEETNIGSVMTYKDVTLNTSINVLDVNIAYGVALLGNYDGSTIYIHEYANGAILDCYGAYAISDLFGVTGTIMSGQISTKLNTSGYLNIMIYTHLSGATTGDVCVAQFDIENKEILTEKVAVKNITARAANHTGGIAVNPVYPDVWAVCNQYSTNKGIHAWVGTYNSLTNTFNTPISIGYSTIGTKEAPGAFCEWDSTGQVLLFMTAKIAPEYASIYTFSGSSFSSGTAIVTKSSGQTWHMTLWNGTYYFLNNNLIRISDGSTIKTYSEFGGGKYDLYWTNNNCLFVVNYTTYLFQVFSINESTFELTKLYEFKLSNTTKPSNTLAGSICLPTSNHGGIYAEYAQAYAKEFFYQDNFMRVDTAVIRGTKLYNTVDVETTSDKVLEGSDVYVKGGKITGTMPNLGAITMTPSSVEQSIPTGYISGGVVLPAEFTAMSDYETCLSLSNAIIGDSNILPVRSGLLLDLEANEKAVSSTSGVVWSGQLSSKSVTVSNGSVDSDYSIVFNGSNTEFDTGIPHSSLAGGYTVILRVYPTAWNNYRGVFGIHATAGIVGLQYENGNIVWAHMGNGNALVTTTSKIPLNTWTTITMVYNADDTASMYINGALELSTSGFGNLTAFNNLIVGKTYQSSERYFKGNMSHCYVYNRGLSQEEVVKVNNYINNIEVDGDVEYTQLEYIEGNGTQYVTTDYVPNSNTTVEMTFGDVTVASSTDSAVILAATTVFSNTRRYLLGAYSGGYAWSGTSSTSHVAFGSGSYSGKHTLSINNNIIVFDGTTVLNNTSTTFTDLTYLSLWKCPVNSSAGGVGRYKLYDLKIYEGSTLVRSYIPVMRQSGEVCLYEEVNGTYLSNAGTGSFVAGGAL